MVKLQNIISFLKKILLAFELFIVILLVHWEKLLFVGLIAFDQLTKYFVAARMTPGESVPVIKNFFNITYVLNPGAAFGILPNQRIFFVVAGVLLLVCAIFFYGRIKKSERVLKFGVINLLSGATANLIDRIQSGLVTDFLHFGSWPVFNIADVAIVVGMFVTVYALLLNSEEKGYNEFSNGLDDKKSSIGRLPE